MRYARWLVVNMVLRGVFVGRFQPFHLGHCHAVKHILGEVDELIIVIGSAQHSHSLRNPFTCGERISMVKMAMDEIGVDPSRYLIVPVPDVENHALWVPSVKSTIPEFARVYSNDPLTSRLFREAGIEVRPIPLYRRERYSATEVRRLILEGGNWHELLPNSVAEFIEQVDGVERIRSLNKTDKGKTE